MNPYDADKVKHVLNTDVIRRLLIRYFTQKGFTESFDRAMPPSLVQDLTYYLPQLASKIEVVPYASDIDSALGRAVLGWNLFVLGSQRMFLGETYHRDLAELSRQLQTGRIMESELCGGVDRRRVTPRQVIVFITRVLGTHESGYVDLAAPPMSPYTNSVFGVSGSSQYYTRPTFGH